MKLKLIPRDDIYSFLVPQMTLVVVTCAQVVGSSVLVSGRRYGGGAVSRFPGRYLSLHHIKVVRLSQRIVLREQAPTIKLDWVAENKWFFLASENHLSVVEGMFCHDGWLEAKRLRGSPQGLNLGFFFLDAPSRRMTYSIYRG